MGVGDAVGSGLGPAADDVLLDAWVADGLLLPPVVPTALLLLCGLRLVGALLAVEPDEAAGAVV